eukprot:SAG31_NODE_774_length_12192_cov_26.736128_13_plen_428_part_00
MTWIELINKGEGGKSNGNVFKLARVLRMSKLFRIFKLIRLATKYLGGDALVINPSLMTLVRVLESLKLLFALVFLGHVFGCMWYAAGASSQMEHDPTHPLYNVGWVVDRNWVGTSKGPVPPNGTAPAWTYNAAAADYIWTRYFTGFFFAFTDMTIENANTSLEQVVACLNHLIYECLYGFILGTLTSIVLEGRKSAREYEEKLSDVREFCTMNRLGPEISAPIIAFYRHLYPHEVIIDEETFLSELPPKLRMQVVEALYKDVIKQVPLFKALDDEATVELCTALRPMVATARTTIFKEGDAATAVYFIIEGVVQVSARNVKLGYLSHGGFFGEMAVTTQSDRICHRTVVAKTDCQLRYLESHAIERIPSIAAVQAKLEVYARARLVCCTSFAVINALTLLAKSSVSHPVMICRFICQLLLRFVVLQI